MTTYYLNSISGSDSNGGTAEDNAFASSSVALAALTGGDVLHVKGGGATYGNLTVAYNFSYGPKGIYIEGYDTTPGDNCKNGIPPKIIGNVGGGSRVFYSNLHSEVDTSGNPYNSVSDIRSQGELRNITINHTSGYAGGARQTYFPTDGNRNIFGLRYYAQSGVEINTSSTDIALMSSSGGHRTSLRGCVFDLTNLSFNSSGSGKYINADSTNYGSGYLESCIFMGNPLESHTAYYLDYDANIGTQTFKNCIFYNLDIGIDITTSLADTASLLATYDYPVIIENCFFINCGTGIRLQSGIDFPFIIKDCVFYNCTSYTINGSAFEIGSINATQNPFDATNRRLNDYGKSLLNEQFFTGFNTVTTDSSRRFYQIPAGTEFTTTDTGSLSLGTGGVGDTVTVSGKSFQKVDDDPIVWRRVRV